MLYEQELNSLIGHTIVVIINEKLFVALFPCWLSTPSPSTDTDKNSPHRQNLLYFTSIVG